MPTIVREDHDDLNITLTVNIPREDYEPEFKKQLKKYSKEVNLKGFRKGQVPSAVIRKRFGPSVLVEIINKLLSEELESYLKEADFETIGQPVPVEHEDLKLATKELKDYAFKFDLGLVPDFEVQGLEEAFGRYDVMVPDAEVEENLQNALNSLAKRVQVEDELQEGDVFKITAKELGEDGTTPKENGLTPTFSLSFDELTEEIVEDVFTKKKGDTFKFNIYQLSKGKDEAFVMKHFLQLDPELDADVTYGHLFEAEILEVNRVIKAAFNQQFFDAYFGPNVVSSEEEAREAVRASYKQFYDAQADNLLYRQIVDKLKAANSFALPTDFLARWIKHTKQESKDKTAAETVALIEESFRWNIIRNKLVNRFGLDVQTSEIREYLKAQIMQRFGMQVGSEIEDIVDKIMEDQQQVTNTFDTIISNKLFNVLKKTITIAEMEIEKEEFQQIVKDERAKNNPEPKETPVEEVTSTNEDTVAEAQEIDTVAEDTSLS